MNYQRLVKEHSYYHNKNLQIYLVSLLHQLIDGKQENMNPRLRLKEKLWELCEANNIDLEE